jgi:septum formation protein
VETAVAFGPISASQIDDYIDSGEPFDKAGAYGIQSGGGQFVTSVAGSYSNVIGLPLIESANLLRNRHHP